MGITGMVKEVQSTGPFVGINPVGGKVFSNNQSIVAKRYGLDNGNISACFAGRLKTHGKWRFEKLSWT